MGAFQLASCAFLVTDGTVHGGDNRERRSGELVKNALLNMQSGAIAQLQQQMENRQKEWTNSTRPRSILRVFRNTLEVLSLLLTVLDVRWSYLWCLTRQDACHSRLVLPETRLQDSEAHFQHSETRF